MSTHAILARPTPSGYEGVYLHSDGYPTHALVQIGELVRRDGVDKVRAVLTDWTKGWSTIGPDQVLPWHGEDRYEVVEGYGVRYLDDDTDGLVTHDDVESSDWVYVLCDSYVVVRHGRYIQAQVGYHAINLDLASRIEHLHD